MSSKENIRAKIIAKAWKDPAFRKKLLSKPKETLNEMGCDISDKVEVRIQEDSARNFTFVLPPAPTNVSELDEARLKLIAAAAEATGMSCSLC